MAIDTFEKTLSILINTSVSDAFEVTDVHQLSIWVPTGWTAAGIALQFTRVADPVAAIATDWYAVADGVGEVALPAAANRVVCVPAGILLPKARWLRLVSGTVASPVLQIAARSVIVTGRRY